MKIGDGDTWAFCARHVIPSARNPADPYIKRFRVVQTPWFAVYVHRIYEDDSDRASHNHPWSAISMVLRGGYLEAVQHGYEPDRHAGHVEWHYRDQGTLHRLRYDTYHRIVGLARTPTWTLVVAGRKRRVWGFLTDRGHVPSREYERYEPST